MEGASGHEHLRRPVSNELIVQSPHLFRVCTDPLGAIKHLPLKSRKHMNVKVPDVLTTGRLIVLANRNTIASKSQLHRECGFSDRALQLDAKLDREIKHVLVMRDRKHNSSTGTSWTPIPLHLHDHVLVALQHNHRMLGRLKIGETKGAGVAVGRMAPHGGNRATRLECLTVTATGDACEVCTWRAPRAKSRATSTPRHRAVLRQSKRTSVWRHIVSGSRVQQKSVG